MTSTVASSPVVHRTIVTCGVETLTRTMPEWQALITLMEIMGTGAYWAERNGDTHLMRDCLAAHDAADVALSTGNLLLGRLLLARHKMLPVPAAVPAPCTRHNAESLAEARAFELARRPHAEKVTRQYQRGLITFWELIEQLTVIDLEVTQETRRGAPCTCGCVEGGYPCEVGTMGAGC